MKQSILFFLCFFTCAFSFAQGSKSELGLKVGLNIANVHDNFDNIDDIEFSSVNYLHAGLYYNRFVTNNIGFGLELLFNEKGTQDALDLNAPTTEAAKLKFSYFSLPILVKFRMSNLVLEAGPELSYRFNVSVDSETVFTSEVLEAIWTEELDLGLLLGLSYQLNRLNFGLRYNLGLGKLSDIQYTDVNGELLDLGKRFQNRVIQVSVGYNLVQN